VIARTVMVAVILVVALALQTTVFVVLPTGWFRPDLMLLIAVAFALTDGQLSGVRVGFAAGLLTDLLVALTPAGIATLVYAGVGYAVGGIRPYLAPTSASAPLIIAFGSGIVGTATYGTIALLLGDERLSATMLLQVVSAVAFYNVVLAVPVFGLVRRLAARFPLTGGTADEPVL